MAEPLEWKKLSALSGLLYARWEDGPFSLLAFIGQTAQGQHPSLQVEVAIGPVKLAQRTTGAEFGEYTSRDKMDDQARELAAQVMADARIHFQMAAAKLAEEKP
jgi:hypothetical protein